MTLLVSAQHLVAEQQVLIGVADNGVVEVWTLQIGQFEGDDGETFPTLRAEEAFWARFRLRHVQIAVFRVAFALLEGRPYQLPLLMDQCWQGAGTHACLLPELKAGPRASSSGGGC